MNLKIQKIRPGTKYQSYRVSIPKSLIEAHRLENCKLKIEMQNDTIMLIPIYPKDKKKKKR